MYLYKIFLSRKKAKNNYRRAKHAFGRYFSAECQDVWQ
jgi:hypothetical protein